MFEVAACGFGAAGFAAHPQVAGVVELPSPGDPEFLPTALSALAEDSDRDLVLVYDAGRRSAHRVGALRGLLRHRRTVPLALPLPLTGLVGAATFLSSLAAAGVEVGPAVSYVAAKHGTLMPSYVLTSSVTGVDLPPVRLSHHMRSWLPGTIFMFGFDADPEAGDQADDRAGVRLAAGALPLTPPTDGVDTIVCGGERLSRRLLDIATPQGERFEVPVPPQGAPLWGKASFFEVTYLRRDIEASLAELNDVARCRFCGYTTFSICPRCLTSEGIPA